MAKFHEGDVILAYHGALIYKAKVLKTRSVKAKDGEQSMQFMVHYDGWNKKWDEWIGVNRMLEVNAANLALQKSTKEEVVAAQRRKKAAKAAKAEARKKPNATRGVKRKIDVIRETEETPAKAAVLKLPMAFALKKLLVDDWEAITQRHKLVSVPRSPSVNDIIDEFLATRKKKDKVTIEIIESLRLYFSRALGTILLYRFERRQYQGLVAESSNESQEGSPGIDVCSVYGAEHLLRLFVKLPHLLSGAIMASSEMATVQSKLSEVLKFLVKHQTKFFEGESAYCEPSTEYLKLALGAKAK